MACTVKCIKIGGKLMKKSFIVSMFVGFSYFFSLSCAEPMRSTEVISVKSSKIEDLLSHVTQDTDLFYDIDEVLLKDHGQSLVEEVTKTIFDTTKTIACSVVGLTSRPFHSRNVDTVKSYCGAIHTKNHLRNSSLDFSHKLKDMPRSGYCDFFTHKDKETGAENFALSVGYHKGVVYTSSSAPKIIGMLFLYNYIDETEWADEIVMIDDQQFNLENIECFFKFPFELLEERLMFFSSEGCDLIALYKKVKEKIKKVTLIHYVFEKDTQVPAAPVEERQ